MLPSSNLPTGYLNSRQGSMPSPVAATRMASNNSAIAGMAMNTNVRSPGLSGLEAASRKRTSINEPPSSYMNFLQLQQGQGGAKRFKTENERQVLPPMALHRAEQLGKSSLCVFSSSNST